jgi:hypothetical protein
VTREVLDHEPLFVYADGQELRAREAERFERRRVAELLDG